MRSPHGASGLPSILNTKVQSRETGFYSARSYVREDDRRSIYFSYRADPETMFPIWNRDESLEPKQLVLGVVAEDGEYKAYSIDALNESRVVNDSVGGVDLVVVSSYLSADALAFSSDGTQFTLPDDAPDGIPTTLLDEDGAVWNVERDKIWKDDDPGADIVSTSGECIVLVRLVHHPPGYAIIRGDGKLT